MAVTVNAAPVAANDTIITNKDTVKTGTLPVAKDADGDAVTYVKASDPSHGTVTVNANGSYTYTPATSYNGPDSFTYTVSDDKGGSNTYTVAITVNAAPTASDTSISTNEDTAISDRLPEAKDVDGDAVSYSKASDPAHGTVEINADGTYTYKPADNYNGADKFTYTVSDGKGGSNIYEVKITVNAVNDAPVASGTEISTNEDTVKSGTLPEAKDVDGDAITYSKASDPAHGSLEIKADGTYTYKIGRASCRERVF